MAILHICAYKLALTFYNYPVQSLCVLVWIEDVQAVSVLSNYFFFSQEHTVTALIFFNFFSDLPLFSINLQESSTKWNCKILLSRKQILFNPLMYKLEMWGFLSYTVSLLTVCLSICSSLSPTVHPCYVK